MSDEAQPHSTLVAPVAKLTDWENEDSLLATLKQDVETARPFINDQIIRINGWLDNLNITGKAKLTPRKGRSKIQPKLIRKQAEWRYGSLSEPFLANDKVFQIKPISWEDTKAARQNELVINWQMETKVNKVTFIDQYIRTAVDEGTVVVRVGWNRVTKKAFEDAPEYSYYPMQDPAQIQELQQASQLEIDNPAAFKQLPPELQESVRYSDEMKAPHLAVQTGTRQVEVEKVIANHPTLEVADIRNLVIDATCGANYEDALFIAFSREVTKSELQKDGRYKNLDAVNWQSLSVLAQPDHTPKGPADVNFQDEARKKVPLVEYWGYFDVKGDGELTPIHIAWIGDVLVLAEENPYPDGKPPFVIVPLLPIKKSPFGEPDGELLEDNQKILGAVTRGVIDLMARSANAQRGMAKNMLDVTNRRRFDNGEDYEFNPNVHPQNGIVEHKFPEIPASAMNLISLMNIEAESLTGVKMFSDQGVSGASLGPTAAGARGALDAASKREMGILRRLAKGMADVGRKIIAMNQEFMSEEEVIRLTNDEFVTVKREELHGHFDMRVEISTVEEDTARANDLSFMLQTIGPLGDVALNKIILEDIATLRRMPELARKVRDYAPQPNEFEQQKQQLELQELQARIDLLRAQTQERQAQAQLDGAKARTEQSVADAQDLEFVETESGVKHARDLQLIERQAEANQDLKITEGILNQRNSKDKDGKVDTSPTQENLEQAARYTAATRG